MAFKVLEFESRIAKMGNHYIIAIPSSLNIMAERLWKKKVRVRIEVIE